MEEFYDDVEKLYFEQVKQMLKLERDQYTIRDGHLVSLWAKKRLSRRVLDLLPEFPYLQVFKVEGRKLKGIISLEFLSKLKGLFLVNTQIKKITNLENMVNLEVLNLKDNKIRRIEGLDSLPNLRVLNLHGNQIRKIEGLDTLFSLQELNLSNNQINKIEGLDGLSELRDLSLNGNIGIKKIEGFDFLYQLEKLDLGNTDIERFENLESLQNLRELIIHDEADRVKHKNGMIVEICGREFQDFGNLRCLRRLERLVLPFKNKLYACDFPNVEFVLLEGKIIKQPKLELPDVKLPLNPHIRYRPHRF